MFLLYYACSVLRSINSRKAFKFLPKRLVLLLYGNQYRHLGFVHKTTYLWSMRSSGVRESSLSVCPGVGGIDCQVRKKKCKSPGVGPGRGGW